MSQNINTEKPTKICFTLEVSYILNGEQPEEMVRRLENMVRHAIGEGMLTGETAAEVDEYSLNADVHLV